jgi:hypothetical protein
MGIYSWNHHYARITKYQKFVYGERYFLYSTKETNYYFRYRQGPVPNIHSYKASHRSYFRSGINCLQEKKKWYDSEYQLKEYGIVPKRRRTPRMLPDSWDDYPYSHGYRSKNWKYCSKKRRQWGGVVEVIYCG